MNHIEKISYEDSNDGGHQQVITSDDDGKFLVLKEVRKMGYDLTFCVVEIDRGRKYSVEAVVCDSNGNSLDHIIDPEGEKISLDEVTFTCEDSRTAAMFYLRVFLSPEIESYLNMRMQYPKAA